MEVSVEQVTRKEKEPDAMAGRVLVWLGGIAGGTPFLNRAASCGAF